uniref:Uncharacterized protein n=1 Tax=Glossina pallidipes TaxID=7398 RepID=A0A1B0AC68_GLOPL
MSDVANLSHILPLMFTNVTVVGSSVNLLFFRSGEVQIEIIIEEVFLICQYVGQDFNGFATVDKSKVKKAKLRSYETTNYDFTDEYTYLMSDVLQSCTRDLSKLCGAIIMGRVIVGRVIQVDIVASVVLCVVTLMIASYDSCVSVVAGYGGRVVGDDDACYVSFGTDFRIKPAVEAKYYCCAEVLVSGSLGLEHLIATNDVGKGGKGGVPSGV